jgi:hypothetical protein
MRTISRNMVSGSNDMGLYIAPRATKDIDFVIHQQPQDIDSFVSHFEGAYYCSKDAITDAVSLESLFNVIDHRPGFKADFVIRKNNEYRLTEFERKQKINFYGTDVFVVSPEGPLNFKTNMDTGLAVGR